MSLVGRIEEKLNEKPLGFFFPIAFILTIIPLLVRLKIVNLDTYSAAFYGTTIQTDLFSQTKSVYLLVFSIILLIISALSFKKIFHKRDKITTSILISATIFIAFTLLSAIFSEYKNVAFWGVYDRAEGFITITCYLMLFIYSIYTFRNTNDYKYIIIPLIILVVINSFLGFFQYIGNDLIKSDIAKHIIIPSKYRERVGDLNLLYEKGKLYGTLFHYNYVGSFVAIILPIFLGLTIFEKNIGKKIILGICSILSLWLLFGSTSRAGIIGVVTSFIVAIIIFGKIIAKHWKVLIMTIISLIIIIIGLNFATNGDIFKRIPLLINDSLSIFENTSDFDYRDHVPVKDITYSNDGKTVEIVFPNDTLKINHEESGYVFKNSKDELVNYIKSDNSYTTTDNTFKNISFSFGKLTKDSKWVDGLLLKINNQQVFMFKLKADNSIHLVNINTLKDIDIDFPETIGFNGKEKLGSSRGYIWSRSLPLIKENLLIGSGPDTFIFEFPQNDLIGKYYAYDTPSIVVDKPHNLYLQIALNQGLVALMAFLAIMVIYIIDSLKLYALKKEYNKSQILGILTCLGVIGYLFAGIFNDSVISVAPVFWIILGTGVAINYINRTQLKENTTK